MKDYYIEYCLSKDYYAITVFSNRELIEGSSDYKAYRRRLIVKDRLVAILRAIRVMK